MAKIPNFLRNKKFLYRVHKFPPQDSKVIQIQSKSSYLNSLR